MDKLFVKRLNIFVSIYVIILTISSAACLEGIAKIEVVKRSTRSTSSDNGQDYDYDVMFNAFDSTHHLKLRSAGSIFSPEFKYHELDVDENEQSIFNDVTPNARELREIEGNIYIDSQMNTAVRLINNADGNFELEGYVNGVRLRRQDGEHLVQMTETRVSLNDTEPPPPTNHTDYVDLHRPMSQPRGLLMNTVLKATPEVLVVLDYENSKHFNFDRNKIIDYLTVFLNSVNNRYSLNTDPKITCQLIGVYIVKSLAAQPFIEKSKNPGRDDYNLDKILTSYGQWVFQNMNMLPKHDTAPLITGVKFDGSAIGLAPVSGACWFNVNNQRSAATSVSQDIGGIFRGSWTVAHELAHNFGSPHDGDGEAAGCPWSQGYLMSYEGWGTLQKFALSPCSQTLIKKFVASSGGSCLLLKTAGSKILKSSGTQVGDIISGKKMCEIYMKDPAATVLYEQNPDDTCANMKCKLMKGSGTTTLYTNHPPGNNAPCGEGGKCVNGKCVGQQITNAILTMDQLCVKITDKKDAKVYFDDPNVQCSKGFQCKMDLGGGSYSILQGFKPKDGTPCGDGGKCQNNACVGGKPLDFTKICKLLTGVANAVPMDNGDYNKMCQELQCKNPISAHSYSIYSIPHQTPNGTLCGKKGGVCQNGKCTKP